MTTKTQPKLLTTGEWVELMYKQFEKHASDIRGRRVLYQVALEQACHQSMKRKVCVNCLNPDNLVLQTGRALIKSADYYMCQECLDWHERKHADEM